MSDSATGTTAAARDLENAMKAFFKGRDTSGLMGQMKSELARQEVEDEMKAIRLKVEETLTANEPALLAAIPPTREVVMRHVPEVKDEAGKVTEKAHIAFTVEQKGGTRSSGSTRKGGRRGGKTYRATLDDGKPEAKVVTATSLRGLLDELNKVVPESFKYAIPISSFNARNPVNAMVAKLAGRLVVEEVDADDAKDEPKADETPKAETPSDPDAPKAAPEAPKGKVKKDKK
jgi:hypothetical protein